MGQLRPYRKGRPTRNPIRFPFIHAYTVWSRTAKFHMVTHMGKGLVLGGQPSFYPNGTGSRLSQFYGFLSTYAYTLWRRTTKFHVMTNMGRSFVFRSMPPSKAGGVPALFNFGGSFLFMHTPFVAKLPNLTWWHMWGLISCGQPRLPSQESGVSVLSSFGGSSVFKPHCKKPHPLTQKDQIRHKLSIWPGTCFRSATPLHLYKCVAQFLSDS